MAHSVVPDQSKNNSWVQSADAVPPDLTQLSKKFRFAKAMRTTCQNDAIGPKDRWTTVYTATHSRHFASFARFPANGPSLEPLPLGTALFRVCCFIATKNFVTYDVAPERGPTCPSKMLSARCQGLGHEPEPEDAHITGLRDDHGVCFNFYLMDRGFNRYSIADSHKIDPLGALVPQRTSLDLRLRVTEPFLRPWCAQRHVKQ